MKESDIRSLFLVIGGALVGFYPFSFDIISRSVMGDISLVLGLSILVAISIAIPLLLLYGVETVQTWMHNRTIQARWKPPIRIGIFDDISYSDHSELFVWTVIQPSDWKASLEYVARSLQLDLQVDYIKCDYDIDSYAVILNPYGSVYPESDLKTFSTMNKIVQYVKQGGLFINIADIPSHIAYDPVLDRMVETSTRIWQSIAGLPVSYRPFDLTVLNTEIGLKLLNVENVQPQIEADLNRILGNSVTGRSNLRFRAERVAIIDRNCQSVVDPVRISIEYEVSPLLFYKFGEGHFLFSRACYGRVGINPHCHGLNS